MHLYALFRLKMDVLQNYPSHQSKQLLLFDHSPADPGGLEAEGLEYFGWYMWDITNHLDENNNVTLYAKGAYSINYYTGYCRVVGRKSLPSCNELSGLSTKEPQVSVISETCGFSFRKMSYGVLPPAGKLLHPTAHIHPCNAPGTSS